MSHLSSEQTASYESALKEERRRILANIEALQEELGSSLTNSSEENGLETHLGDVATVTFLRERDLSIEENEEHLLNEIDAALERLKAGTHGRCVDCGAEIPADRLEALPWAARCIEHEQASGH